MVRLQKKLLVAVKMFKKKLLNIIVISILFETFLIIFQGFEKSIVYLILLRFIIIYNVITYFPFILISIGYFPSKIAESNIIYVTHLLKYSAYNDPIVLDLKNASATDKLEIRFGINALSVRYAVDFQSMEKLLNFKIYISPWYYDFHFKTENACAEAFKKIIKNKHPVYFRLFPWIGFCTTDVSIRGKVVCWTLFFIAIVFYLATLIVIP